MPSFPATARIYIFLTYIFILSVLIYTYHRADGGGDSSGDECGADPPATLGRDDGQLPEVAPLNDESAAEFGDVNGAIGETAVTDAFPIAFGQDEQVARGEVSVPECGRDAVAGRRDPYCHVLGWIGDAAGEGCLPLEPVELGEHNAGVGDSIVDAPGGRVSGQSPETEPNVQRRLRHHRRGGAHASIRFRYEILRGTWSQVLVVSSPEEAVP